MQIAFLLWWNMQSRSHRERVVAIISAMLAIIACAAVIGVTIVLIEKKTHRATSRLIKNSLRPT